MGDSLILYDFVTLKRIFMKTYECVRGKSRSSVHQTESSPAPSVERADPAPLGAPWLKPKAFAALRRDVAFEEPIDVYSD